MAFPSPHQLIIEVLLNIVAKTKEKYVILAFRSCFTCTCSFDLWMSRVSQDTFAMVIIFIDSLWQPIHVISGIFEVSNTSSATMANQLRTLLDSFGLLTTVIAYVKFERWNLNTLTSILIFVFSCYSLQLAFPFVNLCFGHAMSKVAQYANDDINVCVGFSKVSSKEVQSSLYKTITWTNFFGKGGAEWKESFIITKLFVKMLRILMKSKFASQFILFR